MRVQERHSQSRTDVLTAAIAAALLIDGRSANPYARSRKNASILPALVQWIAELLTKKPSALLIFINHRIIMSP